MTKTFPHTPLNILAPAKVNLYLHVSGRRADGYHELDSLVTFTDFGDNVAISDGGGFVFEVDGPYADALPGGGVDFSGNLVMRAAQALSLKTGIELQCRIKLTKNLPVAAGIGGGSADAAATVHGLLRYWGVRTEDVPGFDDLLLRLGADVPACFAARPLRMGGIGEALCPLARFPALPVVLVNPGAACPTGTVFERFDLVAGAVRGEAGPLPDFETIDDAIGFLHATRNDLTESARAVVPAIGDVLSALEGMAECRFSRLSGSGATCFGVFASVKAARDAAAALRGEHPRWWVRSGVLGGASQDRL